MLSYGLLACHLKVFPLIFNIKGFIPFNEIKWWSSDPYLLARLAPLFVFSFTCHQNIFSIHNELPDNSLARIKKVVSSCISIAVCVYVTVATIGYLCFGNVAWSDNIILMYPSGPVIVIAKVAIASLVVLSYPLQVHPCRASLDKVIGAVWHGKPETGSKWLTVMILVCGWGVAVCVDDLSRILALVGATGSTTICYILPVCDDSG
jgi:amino acid permease